MKANHRQYHSYLKDQLNLCGHYWQPGIPLHFRIRIFWIPVQLSICLNTMNQNIWIYESEHKKTPIICSYLKNNLFPDMNSSEIIAATGNRTKNIALHCLSRTASQQFASLHLCFQLNSRFKLKTRIDWTVQPQDCYDETIRKRSRMQHFF